MAYVASGGDLQAAITAAVAGEVITLEAGAIFTGNFTFPNKGGAITIRTAALDAALPTGRIDPTTHGALLPTIRSTNANPAMASVGAASNYTFIGIIFEASNAVTNSQCNIVQLGDGVINDAANLPDHITLDRCVFRAVSGGSAQRGVQANAKNVTIKRCYFTNIRSTGGGGESHAIVAYNSPGPFLIENNYIEAASIGTLFGGAVSAISGNVQSDITIRWNTYTRNVAWKAQSGYTIKNLLELKNAQRVHVYGNLFENNWPDGQTGFSVLFTVRANGAGAPWTTVQDVLFENNILRNMGNVFSILGLDTQVDTVNGGVYASTRMEDVTIRNNLIYDIDRDAWAGPLGQLTQGRIFQVSMAPTRLTIENNTMVVRGATGNFAFWDNEQADQFIARNNVFARPSSGYGWLANAVGEGNAALASMSTSNRVFTANVLSGSSAALYNNYPGNFFPTVSAILTEFVDEANDNYRLNPGSPYTGLGADIDAIEAAMVPEVPPVEPTGPTLESIITALTSISTSGSATQVPTIGGNVSPQAAYQMALDWFRVQAIDAITALYNEEEPP